MLKRISIIFLFILIIPIGGYFWLVFGSNEMDKCEVLVVKKYELPENEFILKFAHKEISKDEFMVKNEIYEKEILLCRDDASKKYMIPSSVLDWIQYEKQKSLGIQ